MSERATARVACFVPHFDGVVDGCISGVTGVFQGLPPYIHPYPPH